MTRKQHTKLHGEERVFLKKKTRTISILRHMSLLKKIMGLLLITYEGKTVNNGYVAAGKKVYSLLEIVVHLSTCSSQLNLV